MRFLVDTNVLLPVEPATADDLELGTPMSAMFLNLAGDNRHPVHIHPASHFDIARDKDASRRTLRQQLFDKYPKLESSEEPDDEITQILGQHEHGSNPWVDQMMLAALLKRHVDFLVTEDRPLLRKAKRLGLQDRSGTVEDAITILKSLFALIPSTHPLVRPISAHELDEHDQIFDSFRADYTEFDDWLGKCRSERRQAWIIPADDEYAAVAIVNPDETTVDNVLTKALKICSFKVSEGHLGNKYGELLLKTIFAYAHKNQHPALFVTVFEKQTELLLLFEDFGFEATVSSTDLGELVLSKPFAYSDSDATHLDPLQFNIRYGPFAVRHDVPLYMVPIQPRFHEILFPEDASQMQLLHEPQPFGNTLRKAYLCHAQIRKLQPGDNLVFYRSQTNQGVVALGIVEQTLVSRDPGEIASRVAKRTVYRYDEIEDMAKKGDVLAIIFRQVRLAENVLATASLIQNKALKRAPQSITTIEAKGAAWIIQQLMK